MEEESNLNNAQSLLTKSQEQNFIDLNDNKQAINEWEDVFFNRASKIILPADARLESVKQNNSPVQFYGLMIGLLDGISRRIENDSLNATVYVQLSFFDMTYKKFYGSTWTGPGKKLLIKQQNEDLNYDESVYFCTPLHDEHIYIVIECVYQSKSSGKMQSCGWSAFRPFNNAETAPPPQQQQQQQYQRISLYHGTPRALLFMDEPFERNAHLSEMQGCYFNYSFFSRPKLNSLKKFLPENVFIGRKDRLGGLFFDALKNSLERPKLVTQLSIILDDLYVYLYPNVSKFEAELAQSIADDKSLWDRIKIEPSMVSISERRIKIGVHNGWRFVHEPHIVHLSVDDPQLSKNYSQLTANKRLSLKSSLRAKATSELDLSSFSGTNRLSMRNSVVLNEVFEDAMCAIVFLIEYVINVPKQITIENFNSSKNKSLTELKKQFETHHVLLRWGAYFPFNDSLNAGMDESRIEINMYGSGVETLNPESRLVFKRPNTHMQDNRSSKSAPGKITFDVRRGNHINFKQRIEPDEYDTFENNQYNYTSSARSDYLDTERRRRQMSGDVQYLNKSVNDLYSSMMPKPDENLQTPLANLLMSQLMSKANESQRMLGVFGGNLELYPIYNPSLHMPVLALAPGQIGGRTMSRAAYAKLQSAKFPSILDRHGKLAEVIDGTAYQQFDMKREEADMLACNQIIFQFLAYSISLDSLRDPAKHDNKPKSVYFTFQFYRFPEFKTPSLQLDQIMTDYSTDASSTPFILKNVEKPNNSAQNQETPGYMISYSVDPTNLKFGEKRMFLQYLTHHAMFIDVWDGESLHHIGTATLQLKDLLRQGREAVQSTFELDILKTEYDDNSYINTNDTHRQGTPYSPDSHIKYQGLLHVRVGNVGSPVHDPNDPINQTSLAPAMPLTRVIASKNSLNSFGENLLERKIDEQTHDGLVTHQFSKAHHMTEIFKDIHAALVAHHNNKRDSNDNLSEARKRKLTRMEIIRKQVEQQQAPLLLGQHRKLIEDRDRDLRTIEFYRAQTKHDQIMNKLHEFITTEYAIYPNFGVVEFFEFVLTNPYNDPQTVTIIVDDPEIQVVADAKEWRHLKILHQIYTQIEEQMFNKQEIDSEKKQLKYAQIFLRPKETINIPFKFQTFTANNAIENGDQACTGFVRAVPSKYQLRKANIFFRAEDRNPISILRLVIDQQPHVVTQTFRFYECENSFLKKTIRIPSSVRALAAHSTALLSGDIKLDGTMLNEHTSVETPTTQLYVRSSDAQVVCESRPVLVGEPHDILIKCPTGSSPSIRRFYVAIYADQYLAVPLQIWQIYVHSLHRVDVSAQMGQSTRFSLILKGTQSSRLVKCFSNSSTEMSVIPDDKFMLGASSVQELNIGVQPNRVGLKNYYLNVVDIETSQLVQSWFVNVNCRPPVVSKAFELTLPVSSGLNSASFPSQKRVSYQNPYTTEKVFILSTNRDDLVQFKERRLRFAPQEQKTIALRFLPNPFVGFVEIYVFINNELNSMNEETFALRVSYVKNFTNEIKN